MEATTFLRIMEYGCYEVGLEALIRLWGWIWD